MPHLDPPRKALRDPYLDMDPQSWRLVHTFTLIGLLMIATVGVLVFMAVGEGAPAHRLTGAITVAWSLEKAYRAALRLWLLG